MYSKYKKDTAKGYYGKIISILHYYDITLGRIPPITHPNQNILRDSTELPTQELLKECIESKNNPLLKATTLLLSSTGLSPVDLLNLTIQDYLDSTKSYHHTNDIYTAIQNMKHQEVIPIFKGNRQKTGTQYITFASNESVKAINNYLQGRQDPLKPDTPLFKTSRRHLNKVYQDVNDQLGLGVTSEGISKFSPKNLRSYHATQLETAGMSDNRIDILQGRKPSTIIRKHYVKVNVNALKEEYIKCLPFLVVDDFVKVKTELEIVKEENKAYKEKEEKINNILERLERLEQGD